MARQLTTFSKLLITLLIVGGIVGGGKMLLDGGYLNSLVKEGPNKPTQANDDVIKIGVVTWGGYAGGQYFNRGFKPNDESRFKQEYGLDVEFVVLDEFVPSRDAWRADEVNLLWCTIDAFPTEVAELWEYKPQVVFQADWSRGGDAVVVNRTIKSASDLRGKKIAVAELTPSHTFLLWLLDAGGLKPSDVEIVSVQSAIDAAAAFKAQSVDAAVVWSPDDVSCVRDVPGATVLQSTKEASHIIADVFIAKKEYVEANKEKLQKLYEGWMKGAAEINNSATAKNEASKILSEGLGIPEGDALAAINNVRLCTHGDNENFYNLHPDKYKGVGGEVLYSKMGINYEKLGFAKPGRPAWRIVADPSLVRTTTLSGPTHAAEAAKEFSDVTKDVENAPAIATKRVTISFRSGEYKLDDNAKQIIDMQFLDIANMFTNTRVRIEGNTDNVGSGSSNRKLSMKRAQSVADYLINEHKMPKNRFVIIGNGPDKPVPGCEDNATEDCKSKNRRTDFELIAG